MRVQINITRKAIAQGTYEPLLKNVIHMVDFLASKYKVSHQTQEKVVSSRKRKYQAAKEETDKEKKLAKEKKKK